MNRRIGFSGRAALLGLWLFAAGPAAADPIIGVTGSCDGAGNAVFTITNSGTAMTSNYTWEIYQNGVFLTSGVFLLAGAPGPGNTQQLTINGLYGNLRVDVRNGTTPAAVVVASATTVCVTPTPTPTRTFTRTLAFASPHVDRLPRPRSPTLTPTPTLLPARPSRQRSRPRRPSRWRPPR